MTPENTTAPVAKSILHHVYSRYVYPLLTAEGFQPGARGDVFRKRRGDCLQRVGISLDIDYTEDFGCIILCAGVRFRSLARFTRTISRFDPLNSGYPAHFGGEVGTLYPPHVYSPWDVRPDTDPEALGRDVARALKDRALRFVEEYDTLESVMRAWEEGHFLTDELTWCLLVSAYWMRGDKDLALERISARLARLAEKARSDPRLSIAAEIERIEELRDALLKTEASDITPK